MAFGQAATAFTYTTANGQITITGYKGTVRNVRIPAAINKLPVTAIGMGAFSSNQLTGVIIGGGVTTIGSAAFQFNKLTGVVIPANVTTLGDGAFADNNLSIITIGANVTFEKDQSFPSKDDFAALYNSLGKQAGTYELKDGSWKLKE
jgi:hypothetical protein